MLRPDRAGRDPAADEGTKVCPYCAEVIKAAAIRCRYCRSDLVDGPAEPTRAGPVVPPAETEVDEPRDPARRRWVLLGGGLALALVLVFLTLAYRDWRASRDLAASEDAARTVRASVTDKVDALLSYDHATFDEDLEAAKEGMTSDFQEEYEPTVAEIRDRAVAQQRSQEAEVVAVAVVSQSPEEVETLVFVNTISSRAGAQEQRLMQNRVSVRMVKQDGAWLVDELSVPQS